MWIISFLPNFVFDLVVIIGILGIVASFFFGFIPFVSQYKLPIQIASIIALVFGIYFEGAISNENVWQDRVHQLEVKLAEAEAKSNKENTRIVEKIVAREKVIKEKADAIVQYVDREIVKYNGQCIIPQEFIKAVNQAAEQPK